MRNTLLHHMASVLKVFFILLCLFGSVPLFAQAGFIKCYADNDGDGYGNPNDYTLVDITFGADCGSTGGTPRVPNGDDCDDADQDAHPGAVWYRDADDDDITSGQSITQCQRPFGYKSLRQLTALGPVCNFERPATRIRDCDDFIKNDINAGGFKFWFVDNDGDGFVANKENYIFTCGDPILLINNPLPVANHYISFDPSDERLCNLIVDCNDNDNIQHPGQEWYLDQDDDGYPLNNTPEVTNKCERPPGDYKAKEELKSLEEDCDDRDPNLSFQVWFSDPDNDEYISKIQTPTGLDFVFVRQCTKPEGNWVPLSKLLENGSLVFAGGTSYSVMKVDCNENDKNIHPDAIEYCNGIDDNCDGKIDETYCCPTTNVLYVKATAAGANNGTSWANAFNRLQDALETAKRCNIVTEIWVTGGSYYPDEGGTATSNDINSSFMPRGGLAIYGGFDGSETMLSQRNLSAPASILSGEIQQDGNVQNNTNNIVVLDNISTSFVLDGFTIRDGYSNIILPENKSRGVGILVLNSTNSVLVRNCVIRQNTGPYGVAVTNVDASPTYVNCVMTGNTTFNGNGAVWNDNASPVFVNCTVANNANSGNLIVMSNTGDASPTIINSILRGTSPAMSGGSPLVSYSLIQNASVWSGTGNINGDPLFVNETGGDLHLQTGSPAINSGNNSINPEGKDLEGSPRKIGVIDMGAYESPYECSAPQQWITDKDNDGYYSGDPVTSCTSPGENYILKTDKLPGDCNDSDAAINPKTLWYLDVDGDGYAEKLYIPSPEGSCLPPQDGRHYIYNSKGSDCNDNDASYTPETVWVVDKDGDGYYTGDPYTGCLFIGATGYVRKTTQLPGDCDDNEAAINPGTTWYLDADGDGFHSSFYIGLPSCTRPGGEEYKLTTKGVDCNDNNKSQNPETVWIVDADGDGYYNENFTGCLGLEGYKIKTSEQPGGCNDADGSVHVPVQYYVDADKDGYGSTTTEMLCSSTAPVGYSLNNTDCNDNNYAINPGMPEICNKIDDNCDGRVDETCVACQTGTGLNTTDITSSSARLTWTTVTPPNAWQVRYKKTNPGAKWIVVDVPGNTSFVNLTGLASKQPYNWQVRAYCGKNWTDYSTAASFTTASAVIITQTAARPGDVAIAKEKVLPAELDVKVFNNPTTGEFTVFAESPSPDAITMRVTDISGRIIELRSGIAVGHAEKLGAVYKAGIYFAELTQAGQRKLVKLIKL